MNTAAAFILPLFLFAAAVVDGWADGWLGVFLESNEPKVTEVIPDSPAAKAGIQVGDLLLTVGDTATKTTNEFAAAVRACKPGERVRVKLQRGGNEMTVTVRVAERPSEEQIPPPRAESGEGAEGAEKEKKPEPRKPAPAGETGKEKQKEKGKDKAGEPVQDGNRGFLGVEVDDADDGGVLVVRPLPGSPAAAAGIAAEDVIVKIGDDAIADRGALEARMAKTKAGEQLAVQLRSGGGTKAVVVTLGGRPAEAGGVLAPRRPRASDEGDAKPHAKDGAKSETKDTAAETRTARTFGTDFAKAKQQADANGKPLLVAYGASWNSGSQAQRRVLAADGVAEALTKFVCVYVDADKNSALLEERGIQELPAIEVLRGDQRVARVDGYVPAEKVLAFLEQAAGSKPKGEPKAKAQPKENQPKPKAEAKGDAAPRERSEGGNRADLEAELQALRRELQEIRKMLEELRREKARE